MSGKHVEFIGVEDLPNKVGPRPFKEEHWGKLVKYSMSVPLARSINSAYDILISHQAYIEVLQPNHGFPVCLIIPEYIRVRIIKLLAAINIITHETKNHYHKNRILPPTLRPRREKWEWRHKPE